MIDEWGGTLTLAEASSRELMRVLKEQDDEFMDNLFNGKCGFTLKCTDGRSVELVPKEDRKTENSSEKPNNCKDEQTETQNSNVILVYDGVSEAVRCAMCSNPNKSDRGCDGTCSYDEKLYERIMKAIAESVAEDEPQTERSE